MLRYFYLIASIALCTSFSTYCQSLPRRPFLGIRLDSVSNETRQRLKLQQKAVVITNVLPSSTGSVAGLRIDDIILKINKTLMTSPQEVVSFARTTSVGTPLDFQLIRDGKKISVKSKMQAFPEESYQDFSIDYDYVQVGNHKLRAIITKPKKIGPYPAILYIQGISCASVDNPIDTANTQTQLINHLTRAGFLTIRVDKPGTGDSEGGPCSSLDFKTEAEGYRKAIEKLSDMPEVNRDNIYIIGHSLGGVWAPYISKGLNVKGIIAYGAIGTNYVEYIVNSRRNIASAMGLPADAADDFVKEYAKCFGLYHATNMDEAKSLSICPDCQDEYQLTTIRSKNFMRQLYELNIPALWKNFDGRVLALWGTSDFISVEMDHKVIAQTVNDERPGTAIYQPIKDSDHGMATAASFQQAARTPGPFNKNVSDAIIAWINNKPATTKNITSQTNFPVDKTVKEILKMDNVENAYPRWGANGKIIFQTNRDGHWQIYAMNEDGSEQRNISNNSFNDNFVSTSPDGKWIGFVSDRDGNEEIYIMAQDGSQVKRLTNNPGRDIHPYFSSDSKTILFNAAQDTRSNLEVYSINVDGTQLKRLTNTPDEETCARFSPDSKKIVALIGSVSLMNDEVFLMNPDGSNRINLTKSSCAEGWPTWSADGHKIYYADDSKGSFSIVEMNADGTNKHAITKVEYPFMDARPEVSPDGKRMLFNRQVTGRNGKNTIAIYIKEL